MTEDHSGLKFYVLNCGCIYYQRVFPDGTLDTKTGIYRDAEDGPCEVCLEQEERWKERIINEWLSTTGSFRLAEILGETN